MTKREQVEEQLKEENPTALFADGYDDAIIGIQRRCGSPAVVAYDYNKVIEIIMESGGISQGDAEELFEFNVIGAWMGNGTPVFIERID